MRVTTAFLSALVAFTSSFAAAAPANVARDIWNPKVLTPNKCQGWRIGKQGSVTWDTNRPRPPTQITRGSAVALAKGGSILQSGLGSPDHPLAKDFNLLVGHVNFTVPNIKPGNDYQVVLFGSSDNWGPMFSITR